MSTTKDVPVATVAQVLRISQSALSFLLKSAAPPNWSDSASCDATCVDDLLRESAYIGNGVWRNPGTFAQYAAEENSLLTLEETRVMLGHGTTTATRYHISRGMFPIFRFTPQEAHRVVVPRAGVVAYMQYMANTITQNDLAAILGVLSQTIYTYTEHGLLDRDPTHPSLRRYAHEEVDAFLRVGATCGGKPWLTAPSFARLREQGVGSLLTRTQALADLNIKNWHILRLEADGDLPVFKFGILANNGKLQVRYTRQDIERIAKLLKPGYTTEEVIKILCVSRSNIHDLMCTKYLETVRRLGDQANIFFTRESVNAFLAEHLVGISPSEWISITLKAEKPPAILSFTSARKFAGVGDRTLRRWTTSGELPHLRTIGGELRIMQTHLTRCAIDATVRRMS